MKVGMGDLGASLYTYIRSGLHVYTLRLTRIYAQGYTYIRSGLRVYSLRVTRMVDQRVATGRVGVKVRSDEIGCLRGGMKKIYELRVCFHFLPDFGV